MWLDRLTSRFAWPLVGPLIGHVTHLTLHQSMPYVLFAMRHARNYGAKMHTLGEKSSVVCFKIETTNVYPGPQAKVVLVLFFTNAIITNTTIFYLVHQSSAKFCEIWSL
jgi:hypothetical protein